MKHLQTFQVFPDIPEELAFLETLSRNIWWCWQYHGVELFRRIDPRLWSWSGRNPILFLTYIPQKRLEELSKDTSFLSHLQRVQKDYERMCNLPPLPPLPEREGGKAGDALQATPRSALSKREGGKAGDSPLRPGEGLGEGLVAYFSMEFGIHESIPLYGGGLGILAGDHLKAASDMKIPLIGIGLLYRGGYFRQFLDQDGWQQEEYPETDIYHLPLERAKDRQDNDIKVSIDGPDGKVHAVVWRLMVGCIPLYLLDTNIAENSPEAREITARLYAGEQKIRVYQEILLGVGGMRALDAMGIHPAVCHLNEGHSAFSSIERLYQIMTAHHVNLKTALEIIPRTTVFTTHTPVAAGNEEFHPDLMRPFLKPLAERLNIPVEEVLSWGQAPDAGSDAPMSMFVLGSRMSQYCNGVSKLHGKVSRQLWAHIWRDLPENEVPITHITNGIHIPSWLSHEMALLFDRYIGPEWCLHPSQPDNEERIDHIYDEELWRAHVMNRSRLIRTCRKMMIQQYKRRNAPKDILRDAELALDQDVLTIAFARRFATYKRAYLLLQDPDRLEAILTSKTHPVQFVFAGKAHPRDNEGKDLIRRLIHFARRANIRHRMVFIEDYDIHLARHLVHGADVWLNTPRRPLEACGTSGMKAAINGVLNVSVLDGWWCEGYSDKRGWRIGNGEEYTDPAYQDAVESQALYNVLENEVIPCFYDRKNGDIPARWLMMMKESMKMAMRIFCSHRMVAEYHSRFYQPAKSRMTELVSQNAQEAVESAARLERLRSLWKHIRIEEPIRENDGHFRVGESFRVMTTVNLGEIRPDEVDVELYYGILKSVDALSLGHCERMDMLQAHGNGVYLYSCNISCNVSGRYGFTARVIPKGDDRIRFAPGGFITWA
ncbi:MAG: alpha-glucan phosphorylase [Desulfobacteraceae bacterium IS3]|nr:MAG: alpha-glucan phosphorylase [Desulfobacteraceae bacterium IS3]